MAQCIFYQQELSDAMPNQYDGGKKKEKLKHTERQEDKEDLSGQKWKGLQGLQLELNLFPIEQYATAEFQPVVSETIWKDKLISSAQDTQRQKSRSEIGSGLNFRRRKFTAILKRIVSGDIQCLVVAHPDRLCRFGFDLIQWLCKEFSCELVVLDNRFLSPEQELITDMLSIVHCFSSRLYGLRKYRKQLGEELRTESIQEVEKSSAKQECENSCISL